MPVDSEALRYKRRTLNKEIKQAITPLCCLSNNQINHAHAWTSRTPKPSRPSLWCWPNRSEHGSPTIRLQAGHPGVGKLATVFSNGQAADSLACVPSSAMAWIAWCCLGWNSGGLDYYLGLIHAIQTIQPWSRLFIPVQVGPGYSGLGPGYPSSDQAIQAYQVVGQPPQTGPDYNLGTA